MSLSNLKLHINIPLIKGEPQFILRTIEIDLDDLVVERWHNVPLQNKLKLAQEMVSEDGDPNRVPDNIPFYVGFMIVKEDDAITLHGLIETLMNTMAGILYESTIYCDGISTIREKDGNQNHLRIRIAWKDFDLPPMLAEDHPLFGGN